jgi:hypothetical protein
MPSTPPRPAATSLPATSSDHHPSSSSSPINQPPPPIQISPDMHPSSSQPSYSQQLLPLLGANRSNRYVCLSFALLSSSFIHPPQSFFSFFLDMALSVCLQASEKKKNHHCHLNFPHGLIRQLRECIFKGGNKDVLSRVTNQLTDHPM